MDLKSGDTIYTEARTDGLISVEVIHGMARTRSRLTTDEARTLANALLGAVAEAEAHQPR
jgi:hypothetical protein